MAWNSTEQFDVLGLGCTAVDDLFYIEGYPAADGKVQIRGDDRQCGGLTATALVAAARMGARCAYAGSLGDDELSRFVERRLRQEGISLDYVHRQAESRPVHSVIVVDEAHHTRTIFYDPRRAGRASPDWPPEELILASKVLFVDPYGIAGMLRAARVARAAGIPVVADVENPRAGEQLAELVELVDHLVVPLDFAQAWTGRQRAGEAAEALWNDRRKAVVVTCGADGCWYLGGKETRGLLHQPAYRVDVVDTTGCGDVFHGAYAAGSAEGLPLAERVRLASAAAALKAGRRGGQTGIPTREAVETFLKERSE
ncbi:MAG: PfkB family carbohydrate kinase [Thermoguttaceae bacterium]|jgi:sulfofructose kinase